VRKLSQLPERPLRLAIPFGVAGLARLDLHAVVTGEVDRRRMRTELAALRTDQRPSARCGPALGTLPPAGEEPAGVDDRDGRVDRPRPRRPAGFSHFETVAG